MADLVFDIGMHNGDDTAYYLAAGFDVVAVEANPVLCDGAANRFRREIESGRLTVRNVGIAASQGELEFWISDHTEWSSFDRANATKGGAVATPQLVPTQPFARLLSDYRTPLYIKVDIECNDTLCIRDLAEADARPRYFSFEGHPDAIQDVDLLVTAGYTGFKCIRQHDWAALTPKNMRRQATIRRAITRLRVVPRLSSYLYRRHYRVEPVNGWTFPPGSSGPFGADLPGEWLSRDELAAVWRHRMDIDRRTGAGGLGEWFDIHATHCPQ